MKKTVNYLVIISCFALGATFVYADTDAHHGCMHDTQAHPHGKTHEKMFKAMDANADGAITYEEFNDYHARKFKEMDVNGDGKITSEDMKSGPKKMDKE